MSQQKDLLREIAAATSQGDVSDHISDWFTEDFRLHEPGKPAPAVRLDHQMSYRAGGGIDDDGPQLAAVPVAAYRLAAEDKRYHQTALPFTETLARALSASGADAALRAAHSGGVSASASRRAAREVMPSLGKTW